METIPDPINPPPAVQAIYAKACPVPLYTPPVDPAADMAKRIELAVGRLSVLARKLTQTEAETVEEAMTLLASVQELITWEPTAYPCAEVPGELAQTLRSMSEVGPRPPAIVAILRAAAAAIATPARSEEGAGDVAADLLLVERELQGVAERALQAARRIALTNSALP